MKKYYLTLMAVFLFVNSAISQNDGQTSKGHWLIEVNTGFGGGNFGVANGANTGFSLATIDGNTLWSIGAEGGYFLADNLTFKVGLGYTDNDGTSVFTYKFGGKYYLDSKIPLQLDITGANSDSFSENPLWLGLQGGHAIFIGKQISIEPGLRYNFSLNKDFIDSGLLEFRVGFVIHL